MHGAYKKLIVNKYYSCFITTVTLRKNLDTLLEKSFYYKKNLVIRRVFIIKRAFIIRREEEPLL